MTTTGEVKIPDVVTILNGITWKQSGQFNTSYSCSNSFNTSAVAISQGGHVALANSFIRTAKLFSVDGSIKCTFKGPFKAYLWDIAVTPDDRYILPGDKELLFYDDKGNRLTYPASTTFDMKDKASDIKSLAVDSRGRIIVGLAGNTISIHQADGQFISKFATPARPNVRGLDVTSKGNIAVTFDDNTLQLMDYFGDNVKVVQPPQGVRKWEPSAVCTSKQGEIFVVNGGDPKAIYRYTADGDECLGCILTGLDNPMDIALAEDGQQLFMTEQCQNLVKIFQRC